MPFHVFLAQSLSLITGGLDAWKLAKDIILAVLVLFTICLVWWQKGGGRLYYRVLLLGAGYAVVHVLLWALHPTLYTQSAEIGIIYNNRIFGFVLLGLGAGLLLDSRRSLNQVFVLRLLITTSTVVAILGVAQYFLPHDLLSHVGYSVQRGVLPAFYIDSKTEFPRVMSTLRDPNSLGAYLILPITGLTALLLKARTGTRRLQWAALLAVHTVALFLTFSRGAWAAGLLSVGLLVLWEYGAKGLPLAKRFAPALLVALVLSVVALVAFRHSYVLKSVLTHSTGKPQAAHDSNGFHLVFAEHGIQGIVRNPFGHGPGTAGLASIQNPSGSFLTENYYIQIGYEVGVLGLLIFLALNVWVYRGLVARRAESPLLVGALLSSFWAYVLMNMLFHMWSNEAVAAQWWITAGLVLASRLVTPEPNGRKFAGRRRQQLAAK